MPVRREIDPAMHDQVELWEIVGEAAAARRPQRVQCVEQHEQPARHATERANVGRQRRGGQPRDLLLPIRDVGQLRRRKVAAPGPARHLGRGNAAQVTAADAGRFLDQCRAAAEQEAAAAEDAAVRSLRYVVDQHVQAGAAVGADHRARAGDVLHPARCRARGHREVGNDAGPRYVRQAREGHLPIVGPEILVAAQRHARLEVGNRGDPREIVVAAEPRARGPAHQPQQHSRLRRRRVLSSQGAPAVPRIQAQQRRRVAHPRAGPVAVRDYRRAEASCGGRTRRARFRAAEGSGCSRRAATGRTDREMSSC